VCSSIVAVACTESRSPPVADVPDASLSVPALTVPDAEAGADGATCAATTPTFTCEQHYTMNHFPEAGCVDEVERATCVTGKQVCSKFLSKEVSGCNDDFHGVGCIDLTNDGGVADLEGRGFDRKCLATCPRCACAPHLTLGTCEDLPNGGMIVSEIGGGAGSCYGCPPARVA